MLRDLATVLDELHDGLVGFAARTGHSVRIPDVEMTLPVDIVPVFKNGGVAVLADVQRSRADVAWRDSTSRLRVEFVQSHGAGERR